MGRDLTEMDRGELFAAGLYSLCHEHGPATMSQADRDRMAKALLETAIEWTKAHNRVGRLALKEGEGK